MFIDDVGGDRLIQPHSRGGLKDRNFQLNTDLHKIFVPVDNLMRFSMAVTSYHRNRSNQVENVHRCRWGDRLIQTQSRGGLKYLKCFYTEYSLL